MLRLRARRRHARPASSAASTRRGARHSVDHHVDPRSPCTALYSVVVISTTALYLAYAIPIWLNLRNKLRGQGEYTTPELAPRAGRWGVPLNAIAVAGWPSSLCSLDSAERAGRLVDGGALPLQGAVLGPRRRHRFPVRSDLPLEPAAPSERPSVRRSPGAQRPRAIDSGRRHARRDCQPVRSLHSRRTGGAPPDAVDRDHVVSGGRRPPRGARPADCATRMASRRGARSRAAGAAAG